MPSTVQRESTAKDKLNSFGDLASATHLGSFLYHSVLSTRFLVGGNAKIAKHDVTREVSQGSVKRQV